MRRRPALLVPAVAAALAVAPVAQAQQTNAPPGNSGITQYLEVVPSAGGGTPTTKLPEGGGSSVVPRQAQRELAQAGATGRALAAVVARSAPAAPERKASGKTSGAKAPATEAAPATKAAASSVAGTLAGSDTADGGMGLLLPVLMGAAALVTLVAAFVLPRRRPRAE